MSQNSTQKVHKRFTPPIKQLITFSLIASGLGINNSHAAIIQNWQADWELINNNNVTLQDNASGGGGGGTITINENLPKNSYIEGDSFLSFDKSAGQIKSGTDINARIYQDQPNYNLSYTNFSFESSNVISFTDQLTIYAGPGGWGSIKVKVETTGSLQHFGKIVDTPYGYSEVKLSNDVSINASLGGDGDSTTASISSDFVGIFDNKFSEAREAIVDDTFYLEIPWTNSDPVDFDFLYKESLSFSLENLDAEYVNFRADNDFGHTLNLYAGVYDQNGNLIPGATITSSQGINFQSMTPITATVPEPSTFFLSLLGITGLVLKRSKKYSKTL